MPRLNLYVDDELSELIEEAREIESEADEEFNISALVRPIIEKKAKEIIANKKKKSKSRKKKKIRKRLKRKPSSR